MGEKQLASEARATGCPHGLTDGGSEGALPRVRGLNTESNSDKGSSAIVY